MLIDNVTYTNLLKSITETDINWDKFNHKTFMLSGATGMIGSFFIDVLMYKNLHDKMNFHIIALGRNEEKAFKRFSAYFTNPFFEFIQCDINEKIHFSKKADYILHLASSTHPKQYAEFPIETITSNVFGAFNLLKYACKNTCENFLFASSVEIYGENRGNTEKFDENYLGYIDSNTLRAGYPEGKRVSESLCQAFIKQKGLNIIIARLARSYGPTMLHNDSKAISQFINKAVNKENIILKSNGNQLYSYIFVADAVNSLFYLLDKGKNGEAYNIADDSSEISLRHLAELLAKEANTNIIFELPSELEKAGYSTATKALLDSTKLRSLGWKTQYNIQQGLLLTTKILREEKHKEKNNVKEVNTRC